ncbi:MAG: hypothetical protein D6780_00490 [Candidatus Dadabacteria bacterium]|nr:MAG: hypothetical protein D6780_00490 [Candidatus Dadabacteria bacterium]
MLKLKRISILIIFLLSVSCSAGSGKSSAQKKVDSTANANLVQAEILARLDSLETEVRDLRGKTEELEYKLNRILNTQVSGIESEIKRIKSKLPPPPIVPALQLERDLIFSKNWDAESAMLFRNGAEKLRSSEFREALDIFQQLLSNISHSLTLASLAVEKKALKERRAKVLFWIAVTYEGLGENIEALKVYNEIIKEHKKESIVPLAMLRLSSVLIRLKDFKTAKLTLRELIAKFPSSQEAQAARKKLKDL